MSDRLARFEGVTFFDNRNIEMVQDVTRAWHRPERASEGPLLVGSEPWEHMPYFECTNWTVLFDDRDGLFKCWYEDWFIDPQKLAELKVDITDPRVSFSYLCYAQSRDGLRWEKPPVGIERDGRKTNIVLGDGLYGRGDFGSVHAATVLLDPVETDPARRFKMIFQHITVASAYADSRSDSFGSPQVLQSPIRLAASPDGIHWTVDERELAFGRRGPKLGDVIAISYDTRLGKYVLCTRHCDAWKAELNPKNPRTKAWSLPYYVEDPARMNKRRIFQSESEDLIGWTEPHLLLAADDEEDELDDSFYGMRRMETAEGYLGLLNVFQSVDNRIDVQLVFSRDGKKWRRLNKRQPIFTADAEGTWDDHNVYMSNPIMEIDGEWWLYYGGAKEARTWVTGLMEGIDVAVPSREEQRQWFGLGLAKLRRDGFVSLRSDPLREGLFITRPLRRTGRRLVMNARCGAGGYIDVEVVRGDEELPRLARESFDRFTGDDIEHVCTWRGDADLGDADTVKLRFWMRGAELFSLRFADRQSAGN